MTDLTNLAVREKIYHPDSTDQYEYSIKNISNIVSDHPVLEHLQKMDHEFLQLKLMNHE